MPIVVRLFEPIWLLFPKMPQCHHSASRPPTASCARSRFATFADGGLATPDRQAVFVCCGACSDCSDAELERRIIERVSEPVAAA